ncbi:MAG: hypothetical protein ACI9KE_005084 [Polyangiales bacterium]|jgi:hypothetical protein
MSDADGSFHAEIPATLEIAPVAAINPSNPSEQAYEQVDVRSMAPLSSMGVRVSESAESGSRQDSLVGENCVISALSSGEFIARRLVGALTTHRPLDAGEQALADAIGGEISGRYCEDTETGRHGDDTWKTLGVASPNMKCREAAEAVAKDCAVFTKRDLFIGSGEHDFNDVVRERLDTAARPFQASSGAEGAAVGECGRHLRRSIDGGDHRRRRWQIRPVVRPATRRR